jgi:hypothetical protein
MKLEFLILIAALTFCSCSRLTGDNSKSSEQAVALLKKPLPTDEKKKRDFLISIFGKEECNDTYTADNWRSNFTVFAEALVQGARDQNLDSTSLRSALDSVLKHSQDRIAYLPVRAYQTTHRDATVWIVVVKWEYPMPEVPLCHVRAFAFDQKTLEQVGFATCN